MDAPAHLLAVTGSRGRSKILGQFFYLPTQAVAFSGDHILILPVFFQTVNTVLIGGADAFLLVFQLLKRELQER